MIKSESGLPSNWTSESVIASAEEVYVLKTSASVPIAPLKPGLRAETYDLHIIVRHVSNVAVLRLASGLILLAHFESPHEPVFGIVDLSDVLETAVGQDSL